MHAYVTATVWDRTAEDLNRSRGQRVRRRVQVFCEARKTPRRLRISIPRHRDIDLRRPDIYSRSIRVQARQHGRCCLLMALSFSRHGSLAIGLIHARRPRLCTREYSPERDQRTR